jgi:hypothetical protein
MSRKVTKNPYLFSANERLLLANIQKHNTPLELSAVTKIPRPTVYITLEKLEIRNLVHSTKILKKRKWFLNANIELNDLIGKDGGTTIHPVSNPTSPTPGVQIYTDKKDIFKVLDRISAPSKTRLQILSGDNILNDYDTAVGKNKIIEFNEKIKASNIIVEAICTRFVFDTQMVHFGEDWTESYMGRSTEVHTINKKYLNHNRQIFIYNNRVYFFMLDRPAILEVSDSNLVKAFMSIFEFIKDYSPNFDMNSYMKEKMDKNKSK